MNFEAIFQFILQATPEFLAVALAIIKAIQAAPPDHQAAVMAAMKEAVAKQVPSQ